MKYLYKVKINGHRLNETNENLYAHNGGGVLKSNVVFQTEHVCTCKHVLGIL